MVVVAEEQAGELGDADMVGKALDECRQHLVHCDHVAVAVVGQRRHLSEECSGTGRSRVVVVASRCCCRGGERATADDERRRTTSDGALHCATTRAFLRLLFARFISAPFCSTCSSSDVVKITSAECL